MVINRRHPDDAFDGVLDAAYHSGTHVMFIHHMRKGGSDHDGNTILGSTAIEGSVDTSLFMVRHAGQRTLKSIQRQEKDIEDPLVLTLDEETGFLSTAGTAKKVAAANLETQILAFLQTHEGPANTRAIRDGVKGKAEAIKKCLDQMCAAAILNSCPGPRNSVMYAINNGHAQLVSVS